MDGSLGCKRRHVLFFNPNAISITTFSGKYMGYLLPALLRATNGKSATQIQKLVRFEVDMALVLSTEEFKWSHALKHKLQEGAEASKCYKIELDSHVRIPKRFVCFEKFQVVPRPILVVKAARPSKAREEEDFDSRIRVLRRLLPGGSQISLCEMISEVESYVFYLKLQVNVLKTLVDGQ